MIELTANIWNKQITRGALLVELDGLGTNRIGAITCQLDYGRSQSESLELVFDREGFFEVMSDTRPLFVEISGNVLIEAQDPTNIKIWEYYWNSSSKVLKGRVNV
jgi:hypothetical protein